MSGNDVVSGRCWRDCNCTPCGSQNASARNPSNFGSNTQPAPAGRSATAAAAIGATGARTTERRVLPTTGPRQITRADHRRTDRNPRHRQAHYSSRCGSARNEAVSGRPGGVGTAVALTAARAEEPRWTPAARSVGRPSVRPAPLRMQGPHSIFALRVRCAEDPLLPPLPSGGLCAEQGCPPTARRGRAPLTAADGRGSNP
jgi:hypothetical protein